MLEERARRARPGALRRVLQNTAAQKTLPLHPADRRPPGCDRRALERRMSWEAHLHRAVAE